MARFKPVESVSAVWDAFVRDPGFVILRTLAYLALAVALGLAVVLLVAIVFGGSIVAAIAHGSARSLVSTLLTGVSLYTVIGFAIVVGLLAWYFVSSIALGFFVSMFRFAVNGKSRYDLFVGFSRSVQFMLYSLLLALIYLVLGGIAFVLIMWQPVVGVLFGVLAVLVYLWLAVQWMFVPIRIAFKGENAVRAMAGSSRMLSGSRWAFAITFVVLVVGIGLVSTILGLIPVLGAIVSMLISFASEPFFVLWLSTSYQQLEPVKNVD